MTIYQSHIEKAHGKINWNKTAQEIYNQFRAFYPWPGVWTTWNGKLLKVTDLEINTLQKTTESSDIGKVLEDGVVVCGQNTAIKIKTLQLEGKKEVGIKDFLNGQKQFIGSVLK
jgi:methionyl-tRNA formyltransferase